MNKIFLIFVFSYFYQTAQSQITTEKLATYLQAAEKAGLVNGAVLIVQKGIPLIDRGVGLKNAETKTLKTGGY